MKFSLLLSVTFACGTAAIAGEADSFLSRRGKRIAEPDFKSMPAAPWVVAKGTWTAADGVLTAVEKKEEKHSAVLWHQVGPESAVIECEFQFDGSNNFIIG
ncbi:MAG TPA: hypothetical protein VGH65_02135, partial [Verrucomicrobiaceae bacterium]